MKNPWTKKNPLMSLWLSGANAVAGRARGQAKAAATRQQAEIAKEATRFWTRLCQASLWQSGGTPKRRR